MKVYIAGRITGLPPAEAIAKFKLAADAVRAKGHTALSPPEMFPENAVWDWAEYMLQCLRIVWHHADAVLMLDNWRDLKGSLLEHHAALAADKRIYYAVSEVPGRVTFRRENV